MTIIDHFIKPILSIIHVTVTLGHCRYGSCDYRNPIQMRYVPVTTSYQRTGPLGLYYQTYNVAIKYKSRT